MIFITLRLQSVTTLEGLPFPRNGIVVTCMAGILRTLLKKRLGIDVIRMMPSGPDTIGHHKGIAEIYSDNAILSSLLAGMSLQAHILPG